MRNKQQGFTIIELMIAIAVTLIMMAAAMMVYQRSVQVAGVVNTRAEMQAELRAATEQVARDLNQAGTGLPIGGFPLPSATASGTDPFLACDATPACYLPNTVNISSGVLYKVVPEDGIGPNTTEATDGIVINYLEPVSSDPTDPNASGTAPNWISPTAQTGTVSSDGSTITMPSSLKPKLDDPTVGLVIGDLLWIQNAHGSALGVVTGYDPTQNTITFGKDPLNFNQLNAPVGSIPALANPGTNPAVYPDVTVQRVMMVTYFLQEIDTPNGKDYRLMRQVGARTPTPVAEHIEDLQFTYDVFDDSSGTLNVNLPSAATGTPPTSKPNQIRKINMTITARSSRPNAQGNYDRLTITTSVGPQNLSYHEKYN